MSLYFRIILILAVGLPWGCASPNSRPRRSDIILAGYASPLQTVTTLPAMAPQRQPGLRAVTVFSDPEKNTDTPMSLSQALQRSLSVSDIVRVAAGSEVAADTSTAYDIGASREREQAALAAFDASYAAEMFGTQNKSPPDSFFGPGLSRPNFRDEAALNFGIVKPLVRGGSLSVFYNPDPGYLYIPDSGPGSLNPTHVGQVEFSLRKSLLRGAGIEVNRVPIQISQLSTEQSAWEFKKAVMASVRSTVNAYWDLYAARVALESIEAVIPNFEEVVNLQEKALEAEWVIYADVAKVKVQLYEFRQLRLELLSEVVAREQQLRSLIGMPPSDGKNIVTVSEPYRDFRDLDPGRLVGVALANNPDILRKRLDVQIQNLQVKLARNGRKPNLELRAIYRMNGVGDNVGDALSQLSTAEFSDWLVGATFSVPIGRREATARLREAELLLSRENGLLQQAEQTVVYNVGTAFQRSYYALQAYHEADRRLRASQEWAKGARVRYENPNPDVEGANWLLQSLNEYLNALREQADSATQAAEVLAKFNTELVLLEEEKGTLLDQVQISVLHDSCQPSKERQEPNVPLSPYLFDISDPLAVRGETAVRPGTKNFELPVKSSAVKTGKLIRPPASQQSTDVQLTDVENLTLTSPWPSVVESPVSVAPTRGEAGRLANVFMRLEGTADTATSLLFDRSSSTLPQTPTDAPASDSFQIAPTPDQATPIQLKMNLEQRNRTQQIRISNED